MESCSKPKTPPFPDPLSRWQLLERLYMLITPPLDALPLLKCSILPNNAIVFISLSLPLKQATKITTTAVRQTTGRTHQVLPLPFGEYKNNLPA